MAFDWDDIDEFFDSDWAESLTIGSTVYPLAAIRYTLEEFTDTADAGEIDAIGFRLMVKTATFGSIITDESLVTFDGVEYAVDTITYDSTKKAMILKLKDPFA